MQKDELARDRMYGRHWQHLNALYRRSDEIKPNLLELFPNKRRIRRCAEKTRLFVAGFFNVISHQRPAAWSHSSLAVAKINVIVDNPQKRLMIVHAYKEPIRNIYGIFSDYMSPPQPLST